VLISEDKKQTLGIDYLEMVYYRELVNNPRLRNHLMKAAEKKYFAQSCRDITLKIPQDYFAIHSGITASALKSILENSSSSINVWKLNPIDLTVEKISVDTFKVNYQKRNGWRIYYDNYVLDQISEQRKAKLPNETGGILIGNYDTERRKIYIVDSLLSPPD